MVLSKSLLLLLATTSLLLPKSAAAQDNTTISAEIAATGLGSTQARLAALPAPTATERFALGGVRFLAGIEHALQVRYATSIGGTLAEMSGLPVLRLPLPPNPDAAPFTPDSIPDLFAGLIADMDGALAALDTITDADDVGLVITTADLWFDINTNGRRDAGEDALALTGLVLSPQWEDPAPVAPITVRFDTADAAWLSAYAHLISGIGEVVLTYDPAEAIGRVLDARAAMEALAPLREARGGFLSTGSIADAVDVFAMFAFALDQQPDLAHSSAAHAHFIGVIEDNRTFWYRVAAETDDAMEWIPAKGQTSALPIPFPDDIGPVWQAVLRDAERLLRGELLLPVWRTGEGGGLNLAALFQNPPPLDLVGVVQGTTLLPYFEEGPLMSSDSLFRFERLVSGDAGLYMVLLN